MSDDPLEQLHQAVERASGLPEETKAEILRQAALLREEALAGEARDTPPEKTGLDRLVTAVEGLEVSHPQITAAINRIAMTLGNAGI